VTDKSFSSAMTFDRRALIDRSETMNRDRRALIRRRRRLIES
jgi:hypothetical protein